MEYFNYGMQVFGPATESISLKNLDEYIRIGNDGHLYFKSERYSENYINLRGVVENIFHLKTAHDAALTHPKFSETIDSMAQVINQLSEENEQLKQRLDTLEMYLKEN